MPINPTLPRRHSIRLSEFDYSLSGAYFFTTVIHNRDLMLGAIENGEMRYSRAGYIVRNTWLDLPHHYPLIHLGLYCVMPNHFHGIIWIEERPADPNRRSVDELLRDGSFISADYPCLTTSASANRSSLPAGPAPTTPRRVSELFRSFKSFSARRINNLSGTPATPVWQRNYYEHVIRNEEDFQRINQYILDNPIRWLEDEEFPQPDK